MNAEQHMEYIFAHGHHLYQPNDDIAYEYQPLVEENVFLHKEKDRDPLPTYQEAKEVLPELIWDDFPAAVRCYNKAWEIAFSNLRLPKEDDGMVSSYIDTAFNGFLFMWDSSFISMYGKYGARVFDFQKTLDNFYARQHMDGFICREICEQVAGDQFHRFDPNSTGPNLLPWAEWEAYQITGDKERLAKVFPPLLAFHLWMKLYRTWPDGTYWGCGWNSGMDNQPRLMPGYSREFHHGHQIWIDTCIQQVFSDKILVKMAEVLGREKDVEILREEQDRLTKVINEKLWDEKTSFYYDLWPTGELNGVKSIGAYWALLADVVPPQRMEAFVARLENPKEFARFHPVPSLSADHPDYDPKGGYWRGGVWAPTNFMVLRGLETQGYDELARKIGRKHVERVVEVFEKTGTLWENYAPESADQGSPAKPNFVGWTGLVPIAVVIEQVFGIHSDTQGRKIFWKVRETGRHGVTRYPMGNDTVDLLYTGDQADGKGRIEVTATCPVTVEVEWPDGTRETIAVGEE